MQTQLSRASVLIIGALAILAIAVSQWSLRGLRLDLSEEQLYSLSEGSKNILRGLQHPVEVELFFSDDASRDYPTLRNYHRRVQDLLDEYQLHAGDNMTLRFTDPEPFSEAEDRAVAEGLSKAALALGTAEVFFGLLARGPEGNVQTIPFFNPADERQLEQQLSKAIYLASRSGAPKVGLLSPLPLDGGFDAQRRQPTPPWMTTQQLQQLFEVETLALDVDRIPEDVSVLVVAHPSGLGDATLYAIDQYLMRGGSMLLLIDPRADNADPAGMAMAGDASTASNPERLMQRWGLSLAEGQVLVDGAKALNVGGGRGQRPQRHLGIYQYGVDNFDTDSPIMQGLEAINFATAGSLKVDAQDGLSWQPLVRSSNRAATLPAQSFAMLFDPGRLYDDFSATGEIYTVAGLLQGTFKTAFPEGAPMPAEATEANADEDSAGDGQADAAAPSEPLPAHRAQSQTAAVLVVADVDFLSDQLWVQVQDIFGQRVGRAFADNGSFFANAVDTLSGNADLMSLRARGRHQRPFTVVEALQLEAEQRFRDNERQLNEQLQETERKLAELQQQKDGEEVQVLSPEQQQAIVDFEREQLQIRKQLRDVQHQLSKDIDSLENWLKLLNILVFPLLLSGGLYAAVRLLRRDYSAPS